MCNVFADQGLCGWKELCTIVCEMDISIHAQFSALCEKTLESLRNRPRSLPLKRIAAGADVDENWLRAWLYRGMESPSIQNVEKVAAFLEDQAA